MAFMGHVTCLPGLGKQPRPSPQAGGWSRHVGVFIPPWRLLGCCWPDDSLKPRWWPWPRAHCECLDPAPLGAGLGGRGWGPAGEVESCPEVVRGGGKEGVLGKGEQEAVGVRHPQQGEEG